jgi:broad specificity phosphatase PhoE
LGSDDPRLNDLKAGSDTPRGFHRLLETAMGLWMKGEIAGEGIESWPVFRERVASGLNRLMESPPNRRVAVFSSGGVIGFAVHRATQSPERVFLDVNWRVRNVSLSEFLFDRERLTLDAFNRIGHLEEGLWSYR